MIRRPPRSTQSRSSAASDVYKRQVQHRAAWHLLLLTRLTQIALNAVGDEQRLVLPIRSLIESNQAPALARREKVLALALRVLRDDRARTLQDDLRRSVI